MADNNKEISLSIEETNKLRAQVGLKPLRVQEEPATKAPEEKKVEKVRKGDDVLARGKRTHEEMIAGQSIGEIIDEEDEGGAVDWVIAQRNRGTTAPRKVAKEKEEKLAEHKPEGRVLHSVDEFQEGFTETVVLADACILDEDGEIRDEEDTLMNVRKAQIFNDERNNKIKAKTGQEYKNFETDALGNVVKPDMLEKYDEIPKEPTGFILGQVSTVDPEQSMLALNKTIGTQSLATSIKFQRDFYTTEEMEQKPAKFRKVKKRARNTKRVTVDEQDPVKKETPKWLTRPEDADSAEEDAELYTSLHRQRRIVEAKNRLKGEEALMERVAKKLGEGALPEDEGMDVDDLPQQEKDKGRVLTATSQFCSVVQTPLEKIDNSKNESYSGSLAYKQSVQTRIKRGIAMESNKRRKDNKDGEEDAVDMDDMVLERDFIDEELLDGSAASALQYLRSRQQLGRDQDSHFNKDPSLRPMETDTTDDGIKIEYRDEYGRVQTPKEAYQSISWQFHGKMPSQKSRQKRMEKYELEMHLKEHSNVLSDELPTMRALHAVQRTENKPYILLGQAPKPE